MRRGAVAAVLAGAGLLGAASAVWAAPAARESSAAARAAILSALPGGPGGAVTIARTGAAQMAQCAAPLTVSFMGHGEYRTAQVACSTPHWTLYVSVAIRAEETVLVTTHAIDMGQPIRPDDFREVRMPTDDVAGAPLTAQDAAIVTAAAPIAPGQTITRTNVVVPMAVHNGETVTVRFIDAGVDVSSRGMALQSGGVGQTILVSNGASRTRITAVILAPDQQPAEGQPFIAAP